MVSKRKGATPARKHTSADDLDTEVPMVKVACSTPKCEQHLVEREVPAGIVVGAGILLTGSLSCTTCGNAVVTVSGVAR